MDILRSGIKHNHRGVWYSSQCQEWYFPSSVRPCVLCGQVLRGPFLSRWSKLFCPRAWWRVSQLKSKWSGFPGGAVVESPPANAGDTGSSPGLGRSHMPRSNWAREPQRRSLCSATREAAIVRGPRTAMKSGPRSPQLEKALAQKRSPNTAVNK